MSASFNSYISHLYGVETQSDCTVVFYCPTNSAEALASEVQAEIQAEAVKPEQPAAQPNDEAIEKRSEQADHDSAGLRKGATEDCVSPPEAGAQARSADDAADHGGRAGSPAEPSAKRRKTAETQTDLTPAARSASTAETQTDFSPEPLPDGHVTVGHPLPAHKLVLCAGSPRFRAQVERWVLDKGYAAKPVLRVPLGDADEHPHALAALKFLYTGKVESTDAASLLRVRRQACYLQVDGCAEACDRALLTSVTASSSSVQQPGPSKLAGVVQLFKSRKLLDGVERPAVRSLLNACRQQLVAHVGSIPAGQKTVTTGGPTLGELLAWAFEDAPSLLSDPESRKQMLALPTAAMEALVGCDSFATDSEATVLMEWLASNAVDDAVRQRLLKRVRLCQLDNTYLYRLLPVMPSWVISSPELRFLQEFAKSPEAMRSRLTQAAEGKYNLKSDWYSTAARAIPASIDGRAYEWHVDAVELNKAFGSGTPSTLICDAVFSHGAKRVVANGLEWYPSIQGSSTERDDVGAYLMCSLPTSLNIALSSESAVLGSPGHCRLLILKWTGDGGGREEGWSLKYASGCDAIEVGGGWGNRSVIKLASTDSSKSASSTSTAAERLAAFEPYVKDGKLWGGLKWIKA